MTLLMVACPTVGCSDVVMASPPTPSGVEELRGRCKRCVEGGRRAIQRGTATPRTVAAWLVSSLARTSDRHGRLRRAVTP